MNQLYTDQDLDAIIASVEEALSKAEVLAKSSLRKDGQEDEEQEQEAPAADQAPEMQEQAPAPDAQMDEQQAQAPSEEAPEEAPAQDEQAAPEEAPAQDEQMDEAQADQSLEQEAQGDEDQALTDEELAQIYGSMDPQELERHYSVIRQMIEQAYAKAEADESEEDESKEEEEKEEDEKDEKESMEKSEKISALEKQIADQNKALENIAKAFEIIAKPQRKAVTEIDFIRKSEAESSDKTMTLEEVKAKANKLAPASLTKSERDQVNSFMLYGEGKEQIEKLIKSKGGN
jgi:hypothetical protein